MNEVHYSKDYQYAFIDGYKFRRDDKSGYYLSTKNIGAGRKRLHRYVWEKHNGPIPKGYEINHIDENKFNNEISNFECITAHEHRMFHLEHDYDKMLPKWRKSLNEHARDAATKWHKSEAGREALNKIRPKHMKKKYVRKCKVCGESFRTAKKSSKFCSGKCRARYRNIHKKDTVIKKCKFCGNSFQTNKYRPNKYDSELCRQKESLKKHMIKTIGIQKLPSGNYIGSFSFQSKKYHTKVFSDKEEAINSRLEMMQAILDK